MRSITRLTSFTVKNLRPTSNDRLRQAQRGASAMRAAGSTIVPSSSSGVAVASSCTSVVRPRAAPTGSTPRTTMRSASIHNTWRSSDAPSAAGEAPSAAGSSSSSASRASSTRIDGTPAGSLRVPRAGRHQMPVRRATSLQKRSTIDASAGSAYATRVPVPNLKLPVPKLARKGAGMTGSIGIDYRHRVDGRHRERHGTSSTRSPTRTIPGWTTSQSSANDPPSSR